MLRRNTQNLFFGLQARSIGDTKTWAEHQDRLIFIQEEQADNERIAASRKTLEEIARANDEALAAQRREARERAAALRAAAHAATVAGPAPAFKRALFS